MKSQDKENLQARYNFQIATKGILDSLTAMQGTIGVEDTNVYMQTCHMPCHSRVGNRIYVSMGGANNSKAVLWQGGRVNRMVRRDNRGIFHLKRRQVSAEVSIT